MNLRDSIERAKVSGPEPTAPDSAWFAFRFPATDPVFAGHFPTRPLVPGMRSTVAPAAS